MAHSRIAKAKINLNLHVIGQGEDGYHQLQSLVVFAEIGDEITCRPATTDSFTINGPFANSLDANANNLVTHALSLFRENWPKAASHPLSITLTKNLPIASGIGGGSADAAATLKLLQVLSNQTISDADLLPLAKELGADVPVCRSQHATLMEGRGEILTPISSVPKLYAVLANPLKSISTPKVFAALKTKQNPKLPPIPKTLANPRDLTTYLKTTRNDLEPPAKKRAPEIEQLTQFLSQQPDCLMSRMSGSGATVFGLFETIGAADKAAEELAKKWPNYWCAATSLSNEV